MRTRGKKTNRHNSVTKTLPFMPKRSRADADSEVVNSIFDSIFTASSAVEFSDPNQYLTALKARVLSDLSFKGNEKTKAATEFTLSEAINTFGLKFEESLPEFRRKHLWDIENEVGMKEFPTTPCIGETLALSHIKRD